MNIALKLEYQQFIQSQIEKGNYANVDEVISAAFRLLEERERRLEELSQKIAVGTEQIVRGQVTDGEIVFTRLQEKINNIAESGA